MTENAESWQAELTQQDRDRYMCALKAPPAVRQDLLALLAWNAEVARVADQVREPMAGLIRQTWWREVLEEVKAGKPPRPHLVVRAMAEAITKHDLPLEPFAEIVHARGADLEKAPFQTLDELEVYCAQTAGVLQEVWTLMLNTRSVDRASPEPASCEFQMKITEARNTGIAWGLIGTIRATHHLAHQDKLRLPTEMLDAADVKQDDVLRGIPSAGLADVTKQIVKRAEALTGKSKQPLAILTRDYAKRIRKAGYYPFDPRIENGRAMRAFKLLF